MGAPVFLAKEGLVETERFVERFAAAFRRKRPRSILKRNSAINVTNRWRSFRDYFPFMRAAEAWLQPAIAKELGSAATPLRECESMRRDANRLRGLPVA